MLEGVAFPEVPGGTLLATDLGHGVFDASDDCVKVIGLGGELLAMNGAGQCLMEIDDFSAVRGQPWASLWPEPHRATVEAAVARAREGKVARFSAACPTAKGEPKWWEVVVSPVFGEQGQPVRLMSISRDVTAQRQVAAENALLVQELAHRIKNMFAVVDGVISLSARAAPESQSFAAGLRQRLQGLGRAIAYVSPLIGGQTGAHTLHGLLHVLLEPYGDIDGDGRRVRISGDDLPVGRSATTSVALFANELATNALKYGALSQPGGSVQVTTELDADRLRLTWRERGGGVPEPRPLAFGDGFGSTLMDNAVMRQLAGRLAREWADDGLLVHIDVPLDRLGR
jgi:PAS domain S-box-containing protein